MQWTFPGTVLTGEREEVDHFLERFDALFLAGGLTLSQVTSLTGMEAHTVQNWVKRGFLPPPKNKRYDPEQVCRILNLQVLKGAMPLDEILRLMRYLNGDLADEGDDLVDDRMLYGYFVRLAAQAGENPPGGDSAVETVTRDYPEKIPGAREKLNRVLKIMLTAWLANCLKAKAEQMLSEL